MYVRKSEVTDARAINTAHVNAYKVSYRGYMPDEIIDAKKVDEASVERTAVYVQKVESYVAEYHQEVIGFAHLAEVNDDVFEINALYVEPKAQRLGAGKALVSYVCDKKREEGKLACVVWTMKNGPSLGFYEKTGFKPTGNKKMWHGDVEIIELSRAL